MAVTLLAMVPGPATALVVRRSILHGPRAAAPLIAGIEIGLYCWALAAAFGAAALVTASVTAFVLLKVVGAAVLVVLGIRAWRSARDLPGLDDGADGRAGATPGGWRAVGTGAVTNLANPKAATFAFAFYPQFVPAGTDVVRTTLLLALGQVVIDACWYLAVALLVGQARAFFARGRIRAWMERATGTVLIGLGIRVAAAQHR